MTKEDLIEDIQGYVEGSASWEYLLQRVNQFDAQIVESTTGTKEAIPSFIFKTKEELRAFPKSALVCSNTTPDGGRYECYSRLSLSPYYFMSFGREKPNNMPGECGYEYTNHLFYAMMDDFGTLFESAEYP